MGQARIIKIRGMRRTAEKKTPYYQKNLNGQNKTRPENIKQIEIVLFFILRLVRFKLLLDFMQG
jgi:hypothetical protein